MLKSTHHITYEQKVQELQNDIQSLTKVCQSGWARPIDYTNLIDAQYVLQKLKQSKVEKTPSAPLHFN